MPFKDSYRRYKIKHGQGNNDYLSLQEVVSRRYREAGVNNELFPDIILIDGGLGQLHAALATFTDMPVKPPMVISLAKKGELIYRYTQTVRKKGKNVTKSATERFTFDSKQMQYERAKQP